MSAVAKSSPLLSREAAAEFLGVKPSTLAVWACVGRYGLKFYKVGRSVKYKMSDLENFLKRRARCPGEDVSAAS
jgi:predicted site-specific integrase-resolvase